MVVRLADILGEKSKIGGIVSGGAEGLLSDIQGGVDIGDRDFPRRNENELIKKETN